MKLLTSSGWLIAMREKKFCTFFSSISMGIFLKKGQELHPTVSFFIKMLISSAFQNIGLLCSSQPFLSYFSLSVKILYQKSTKQEEIFRFLPVFFIYMFSKNISSSAFFLSMKCIPIKKFKTFCWFVCLWVGKTWGFKIFAKK